ncbi:MAG: L-rhamnonate dehydratase [Thermoproteota archaeon]|nr:L-rhamnonate dehydratase [Thermoproteota archaeon]
MAELKITDVRAFTVYGDFPFEGERYMEERLVRPVDIYPEHFEIGPESTKKTSEKTMELARNFLEITTEVGIVGLAPLTLENWWVIDNALKPLLIGRDALTIEKIWDQMYRVQVHGRKCQTMIAISAVDCCLWDLIGKYRKEPVHRLLGGPVKEKIRIYASMLGHSLEPKLVAERAQEMADLGYTAQKWFFRYGPSRGIEGEKMNLELAKTFRDSVGYDSELMLDCWMSWNIPYTIKMAKKLERYELAWLEEVLLPDQIDGYAEIRSKVDIPLSGAEHEYTRWGFMEYLQKKALDFWQPDITWAGGISEVNKICTLGSTVGIPIIPHSGNARMSSPIWFSHNMDTSPIGEYLVKHNALAQYFYKKPLTPSKGYIQAPTEPGLGIDLDEEKILKKEYLK